MRWRKTVLDIIHTHPSHQGRGAGAQLVKWGTDTADKERLQCYTESSPAGYPLFQQCGFEDVAEMEIELNRYKNKKSGGYGQFRYKHIVMIRSPADGGRLPPPAEVPSKDDQSVTAATEKRQNPIGEWDFGLGDNAVGEGESTSGSGDDGGSGSFSDDEQGFVYGGGGISDKNRQYGIVGAVGGTRQEPFRPMSHYVVMDTVSEGGYDDDGVVSRPTSHFVPGDKAREEDSRPVSLI